MMTGQKALGLNVKLNLRHNELPLCAGVKSLSQKCLLHKYLQCSIFYCSVLQVLPTLPAHTTAL
jgi:hypothetical protein